MSDLSFESLLLEHLKRIRAEQAAQRKRDREIIAQLDRIEVALARVNDQPARAVSVC